MYFDIHRVSIKPPFPTKYQALFLDFDGVMTDNTVFTNSQGDEYYKFCKYDSTGIIQLAKRGVSVWVISSATTKVIDARCKLLQIPFIAGVGDKKACVEAIVKSHRMTEEKGGIVFMGNDLQDAEIMASPAIIGAAPFDAAEEALKVANIISGRTGGNGAIRSVAEFMISAPTSLANYMQMTRG